MNLKALPLLLLLPLLTAQLSAQEKPKTTLAEFFGWNTTPKAAADTPFTVVAGTLIEVEGNQATVRFDKKEPVTVELMKSAMTVKDGTKQWDIETAPPNKRLYFEILDARAAQPRARSIGEQSVDVSPVRSPPLPVTPTSDPTPPVTPIPLAPSACTPTPRARLFP